MFKEINGNTCTFKVHYGKKVMQIHKPKDNTGVNVLSYIYIPCVGLHLASLCFRL